MSLSFGYMGRLWIQLLQDGGWIIPFLLGAVAIIWWAIGSRFYLLFASERSSEIVWERRNQPKEGLLDDCLSELKQGQDELYWSAVLLQFSQKTKNNRSLILTGIAIAPLLGLLGTVGGMIETFKGLGDSALFSQTGGVAGGIAQALLTTQMGLVIAVPGIFIARILDNRAKELRQEMVKLLEMVRTCEE